MRREENRFAIQDASSMHDSDSGVFVLNEEGECGQ